MVTGSLQGELREGADQAYFHIISSDFLGPIFSVVLPRWGEFWEEGGGLFLVGRGGYGDGGHQPQTLKTAVPIDRIHTLGNARNASRLCRRPGGELKLLVRCE